MHFLAASLLSSLTCPRLTLWALAGLSRLKKKESRRFPGADDILARELCVLSMYLC